MSMRKMEGSEFDPLVNFFDEMVQTDWLSAIHAELKLFSSSWENKRVLDVGCGTGRFLLRGVKEAKELVGVDISGEMVKRANDLFTNAKVDDKAHAKVGDALALAEKDATYDRVFSTCALFLLPSIEIGIAELRRVTKPDGEVFLLNPAPHMSIATASSYAEAYEFSEAEKTFLLKWATVSERRHRKSETELTRLLTNAGFSQVEHRNVLNGLGMMTKAY
ncbi:class I SAM-dependent methyltransferase [Bacillus sp. Marseille-P3800]|uniref:class I SAM-dependent methyltransferase n=1 Tax=Bacillus sp. Marseille-P3800 TaxID=2014782 RepID=UPI00210035D3|nr:class I SAM-dependent methyltransferase [Bacillus sp. Marseille-P3800]